MQIAQLAEYQSEKLGVIGASPILPNLILNAIH